MCIRDRTRGRCDVVLQDDGPVLLPPGSPSTSGADLSLLLDDTGLKVLPTGTRLGSGDRVRLHRGGRLSWLRVELPAAPGSSPSWPGEQEPPPGITAQEANPSRPLTVDAPSRRRARLTMITGALPLLAGIGIAVVTHWWFFLVFSALGAVTTVVGWVGERGARRAVSYTHLDVYKRQPWNTTLSGARRAAASCTRRRSEPRPSTWSTASG